MIWVNIKNDESHRADRFGYSDLENALGFALPYAFRQGYLGFSVADVEDKLRSGESMNFSNKTLWLDGI